MGKKWKQWQTLFSWAPKSLQTVTVAMKLRHLFLGRKAMTNLDSVLESRAIILLTKVPVVKTKVFPVVMYRCELNHKECWALKDSCLPTPVLEKTLESPLDCKEIKPVKGNQPWIFIGRTDVEAKVPIFWLRDAKSQFIGEYPNARKDWGEEKGVTEDEMVGWHHWLNGHEFEQTLGDGEGQGNLACCSPWGCKESNTT